MSIDIDTFGWMVTLRRTNIYNEVVSEEMPAPLAIIALLYDSPMNGKYWKSGKIIAPAGVNMREWDTH